MNLLIEVGTEELPEASLNVIYSGLADQVRCVFQKNRLAIDQIQVEATPRRIALFVSGLPKRQSDELLEISGPSYEKSFDASGKPTAALKGFLKSKDATEKDVLVKETPKGKFISVRRKIVGKPVAAILPSLWIEVLQSLPFPKLMRWDSTGFRFPRPIRWMVALLDRKIVPIQLGEVKAGSLSYGHRFLAPRPLKLQQADWKTYQKLLKAKHVIIDLKKREEIIRSTLQNRFGQKEVDEGLVHTTAQLVEEPYFLQGSFSKTYLDLPAEVLASCMKKNQKIFACYDSKERLSGKFVAVMNGKRKSLGRIRDDYENVLESRLRDARYFYETDTKEPLEKKVPLLEQLVFLGKLGNMLQKSKRMEKFAERLCDLSGHVTLKKDLVRVARLSKADLMTQMVYEFPDLQGIVGRDYALETGEKENVADALGTQYLPKNLSEDYRKLSKSITPLGALFGILDRLDLLVGAFGTALEPTGSQDPFALRRAGGCLVKLIRAFKFQFSLSQAVSACMELYGNVIEKDLDELKGRLQDFFKERVAFELQVSYEDRSAEIFQAVWASSCDDLADIYERYDILMKLYRKNQVAFLRSAKVVERTSNILKGAEQGIPGQINPDLFQESLENELYEKLNCRRAEIINLVQKRDYEKSTLLYGEVFYSTIHEFFDKVMVNVEDASVRQNRQALLKQINSIYTEKVADLSLLSKLEIT